MNFRVFLEQVQTQWENITKVIISQSLKKLNGIKAHEDSEGHSHSRNNYEAIVGGNVMMKKVM